MSVKLYVIPASHPCMTAELMLQRKGIDYKRRDLVTAMHIPILKAMRFPSRTVPAIKTDDGRKIQGTREISRYLDELQPEPPLFPADKRAEVEEAERWGDEELQMVARRIALAGVAIEDASDGRLGPLLYRHAAVRRGGVMFIRRFVFTTGDDAAAQLRARLPAMLDRIDAWIADGTLNGEQLNAADYVIAPSLALLWYVEDLRPELSGRPLIALLDRVLPEPQSTVT
jgi:glutathione S-transferase